MKTKFESLKGAKSDAFHDIPEGYFDDLRENIMHSLDENSIKSKSHSSVYAIAALVLLFITIGIVFLFQNNPFHNENKMIAQNGFDKVDSMKNQSKSYNPGVKNDSILPGKQVLKEVEFDSLFLNDISNEDILQYLIEMEEFEF